MHVFWPGLVISYLKKFRSKFLSVSYFDQKLSLMCLTHIKIGYFCLLSSIILKNISLGHATRKYHILKLGSSKLARILSQFLLCLLIITFLLIGIVNLGMLNPGPSSLKICYQNVQGLIPIKDLTLKQPSLNMTKICELNAYININRPDVIMLNETWLKKSVNDRPQASHHSEKQHLIEKEKQHLIYFTALHSQIIYIYLLILKSKKPPFCIESSRKKFNGQN